MTENNNKTISDPQQEDRLRIMRQSRNALSTMLRACMVDSALNQLKILHERYARRHVNAPIARGLVVKGSAGLGVATRRPEDLDVTVYMTEGYDAQEERAALIELFHSMARKMKAKLYLLDDSTATGKKGLEQVRHEKGFVIARLVMELNEEHFKAVQKYFLFWKTPESELDRFKGKTWKQLVADVVAQRELEAERLGKTYIPTDGERAGISISEVIECEISTTDKLHLLNPVLVTNKEMHNINHSTPMGALTFAHPMEAIAQKFLTVFTNKARSNVSERHAKDLFDLFIRTARGARVDLLAYHQYVYDFENDPHLLAFAKDMVRIGLASREVFHEGSLEKILVLKHNEKRAGNTKSNVARGLKILYEQAAIGEVVFGEPITQENANHFAGMLLDHSWKLLNECIGVTSSGTAAEPIYSVHPPRKVGEFWRACQELPAALKKFPKSDYWKKRDSIKRELAEKIGAMLEGEYPEAIRKNIMSYGAENAVACAEDVLARGQAMTLVS